MLDKYHSVPCWLRHAVLEYKRRLSTEWVVESERNLLSRSPWIEVFEEHIRLPNGQIVDDFFTVRLRDFVVVAPITPDGGLVTVTHYRHGCRATVLSLPSGFIESDENPLAAARRELREETGFAADDWSELGAFVVDGNRGCGKAHMFMARGARRVAEPASSDLASISVNVLGLEQATKQMWRGDIGELACASALAMALLRISDAAHSETTTG